MKSIHLLLPSARFEDRKYFATFAKMHLPQRNLVNIDQAILLYQATMIRPYTSQDIPELINLLRLNTPQYFAASEESDFIAYLNNYAENYFVVEENGKIIGSGGINYLTENTEARISWDIIHPELQARGVGKKLTLYRIEQIKKVPTVNVIYVRTTQLVYQFYEKMGFALERTEKDYWAQGFDLYQMKIPIK